MNDRAGKIQLGIGAIVAAVLFVAVVIPNFVSAPSNVPNVILSPRFWPNAIALFTGLTGIGLLLTALRHPEDERETPVDVDHRGMALLRLSGVAVVMLATVYAMPRLGLVWTTMVAFIAVAFLVRTHHPVSAVISAVAIPLLLYAFFAHVAGVAIPQGEIVRLP